MKFSKRLFSILLTIAATALLIVSYTFPSQLGNPEKELAKLERALEKRLRILDSKAYKTLEQDSESLFTDTDIPKDFILYCYEGHSLKSWSGQFPIQYDEFISGNRKGTLSRVGENYSFFSFAGNSFLIRYIQDGDKKVVAGLKLDGNTHLRTDRSYEIKRLTFNEGETVKVNGEPVFKVVFDFFPTSSPVPSHLAWIAYLLIIVASMLSLSMHPKVKHSIGTVIFLYIVALINYSSYTQLFGELTQIFLILLIAVMIHELALCLFLVRKSIWRAIRPGISTAIACTSVFIVSAALLWFIYISIYKVLVYTHITLDLHRLWGLGMDTLVVYIALFLMFQSLAIFLNLLHPVFLRLFKRKISIFTPEGMMIFALFAASFCVVFTTRIGSQRETLMAASWAENLSRLRDNKLENHLKQVDRLIAKDEVIAAAGQGEEQLAAARTRLNDKYLSRFLNAYDVRLQTSRDGRVAGLDESVSIAPGSHFKYAPVSDQYSRYVAAFNYFDKTSGGQTVVYVILEPKFPYKRSLSMILDAQAGQNIPARYSYAMYKGHDRQYVRGNFPYPTRLSDEMMERINHEGEISTKYGNYRHFIISVDNDSVIFISRPYVGSSAHFISTIVLALLFFFGTLPFMKARRKPILFEKNYFKRSLTILIMVSLTATMAILAFVSISFVSDRNNFIANRMMADKINVIRFQLQNGLRSITSMQELSSRETSEMLRHIGDNTGSDISLYRPDGKVIMSTAPELHERHIMGYRMSSEPYYQLIYRHQGYYIRQEVFGNNIINMLYAPVLNDEGRIIALLASPYVDSGNTFQFDALMHTVNIVVVFLILLILSLFLVSRIIDHTFRPLSVMSRKMSSGGLEKLDNIGNRNGDEISDIINSYNRMVDALAESSEARAQLERNKAWSEMARNVAHEIKNPLTPMQLQVQRVQRLKENGDPTWPEKFDNMADVLLENIQLLSDSANQFSNFAKLYTEDMVEVDLDRMLQEQIGFLNNYDNIHFIYLHLEGAKVMAPKPQLQRVLVNILENAVQACSEQAEGQILVALRTAKDDTAYEIVIEDNGPGVSPENIDRLFTPNFTTKNGGTGLGLAICKSILDRCDATISYSKSFALGGACFTICYPKNIQ